MTWVMSVLIRAMSSWCWLSISGTPIEVTAYKLGDKYYGARSNEFGYVNYEIIPAIPEVNPLGPGKLILK